MKNVQLDSKTRILNLTIKRKWFDMILSGEKKEEYREVKPYWQKRITCSRKYDYVNFVNGYRPDSPRMLVKCKNIVRTLGLPEWGAPINKVVYVIRLGDVCMVNHLSEEQEDLWKRRR